MYPVIILQPGSSRQAFLTIHEQALPGVSVERYQENREVGAYSWKNTAKVIVENQTSLI